MKCWCGGKAIRPHAGDPVARCADSEFHDPTATGRPERVWKLYIAGPMSGYPECNYPAFQQAAKRLAAAGYEVVDPSTFGAGRHYVDFIREDLRMMLDCHAVATLEGWWESPGARNEVANAGLMKMPIRSVEEWLARPLPQEA